MKLLHVTFRFEFSDAVEAILDRHRVADYIRHAQVHGKDRDGKHYGTKVHPGSATVVQVLVEDEKSSDILEDLRAFQKEKDSHAHLRAVVLPVEEGI